MNRSNEIIHLFEIFLPNDLVHKILHFEKKIIFNESQDYWITYRNNFIDYKKNQLYYDSFLYLFLHEIKDINGDKYKLREYNSHSMNILTTKKQLNQYYSSFRY